VAPVPATPQAGTPASVSPPSVAARTDPPVPPLSPESRFTLLEHILHRLYRELEGDAADGGAGRDGKVPWRGPLEERLYLKGAPVRFIPGGADSGRIVEGRLQGIGAGGELLILPPGAAEPLAFVSGELDLYGRAGPSSGGSPPCP
jgi:hypothetical protein